MEKASTSASAKKGKKKGSTSASRKKKKKKNAPKQAAQSKKPKPKVSDGKPKGKCFTCGQKGHQKNDCPKKRRTKNGNTSGMPLAFVVKTCLMACTTSTWCVDTGATNHVCNSYRGSRKFDGWLKERSTCGEEKRPRWQQSQWEWCL